MKRINHPQMIRRVFGVGLLAALVANASPVWAQPPRGPVVAAGPAVNVPVKAANPAAPTKAEEPEPAEPPDSREPTGPHGKLAPVAFYQGGAFVEAVFGTVELVRGEAPKVSLQAALFNRSGRPEQLSFGVRGEKPVPVVLAPGARATVPLAVPATHVGKGDGPQLVRLDLVLMANGLPLGTPPERADLQVRLPQGVTRLLRANQPLKLSEQSPERGIYRLSTGRGFLTELQLAYNGGPVTLELEKSLEPGVVRGQGPVAVKLTVHNRSGETSKGAKLTDSFDPRDFDGAGEGFQVMNGKDNDARLLWEGEVPPLAPGQSHSVVLKLMAKHPVGAASLSAAMATIDGSLVGVSNKIVLAPLDGQR